ncbi:tandem-95 repeat protein [Bradyrhizobium sp. 62]|uniref:Ig-like domain-containing protein n=1 Tax=Bradyrhizobium sp. 62 TaxID=1043588 RepID=UPI001FFBD698
MQEHGPAKTVTASYTDPDVGDTHSFAIDTAGTKGKVVSNGDGTFSYDPNGVFIGLKAGEAAQDTFKYTVTDGSGASSSAIVTITIKGENDAPVAKDVTADVQEHGPSKTVTAAYTDADLGDAHSFAIDTTGTKGKVVSNGDGTFSYDPNGVFVGLKAGDTVQDKFSYTVTDGSGASSTATATITVIGENDAPIAKDVTADVQEHGPSKTIAASYTDPDLGDKHSFAVDTGATKGKVVNNGDGTFTYDPNGAFIGLKLGETTTDTFDYVVKDAAGASSTATVTITIIGENETPFITSGPQAALLIEDAHVSRIESGSGTIGFTDADIGDMHAVSFAAQGASYVGLFGLTPGKQNAGGGAVDWTFLVPDSALDHLSAGQTLVQKYTVTIDDGHGGQALETVTVTISGTNDAPVITGGKHSADVTVDDDHRGEGLASGTLAFVDIDLSDKHVVSVQPQGRGAKSYFGSLEAVMVSDANGGGQGSVQWTYRAGNQGPDLRDGERLVQLYDVTVDDGRGGKATQTVSITLVGVGVRQEPQQPFPPYDFKLDSPKFPEIKGHTIDVDLLPPMQGLQYLTFVAYSGWLPHQGGAVNTKSLDPLPEPDEDVNYCPIPPSFTPWMHGASPFSLHDMQHQLQLLDSKSYGTLSPKPSAGADSLNRKDGAPLTDAPTEQGVDQQPGKSSDGSRSKRGEAAPQPSSADPAGTHVHDDRARTIDNVAALVAAPLMLSQGATLRARARRGLPKERSLGVSFTSAGGVKSVVFKLSYDAERLSVIGVEPGTDLPEAARVMLSCMPNDGTAMVRISVTSDEELPGGTVDLASLSVRYLDATMDGELTLVAVDVNGETATESEPVRIRLDSLPLSLDAADCGSDVPDHPPSIGRSATQEGRVRISMDTLGQQAAAPPPVGSNRRAAQKPIRIAIQEAIDEASEGTRSAADHLLQAKPFWPAAGTAASKVRIPTASLNNTGPAGSRISIP